MTMSYDDLQAEKGLFTFYKQQESLEEQIKQCLKKRKKTKRKQSKQRSSIKLSEIKESSEVKHQKLLTETHELRKEDFLKNVLQKRSRITTNTESTVQLRLRTEPQNYEHKLSQQKLVKQRYQDPEEPEKHSKVCIFHVKDKRDFQYQKHLLKPNKKVKFEQKEIFLPQKHLSYRLLSKIEPINLNEGEIVSRSCKNESKPFLQKLKLLDNKSNSSLMSSYRESNRENPQKRKGDLSQENQKYFHQLISNFYKNSEVEYQSAYKMLKNTLKFPHLTRQNKVVRLKTQERSPIFSSKKLVSRRGEQQFCRKREPKVKISDERYAQLYKLSVVKELRDSQLSNQGRSVNLIDMSRDYNAGFKESQERISKKKLAKSKLGVDL